MSQSVIRHELGNVKFSRPPRKKVYRRRVSLELDRASASERLPLCVCVCLLRYLISWREREREEEIFCHDSIRVLENTSTSDRSLVRGKVVSLSLASDE